MFTRKWKKTFKKMFNIGFEKLNITIWNSGTWMISIPKDEMKRFRKKKLKEIKK